MTWSQRLRPGERWLSSRAALWHAGCLSFLLPLSGKHFLTNLMPQQFGQSYTFDNILGHILTFDITVILPSAVQTADYRTSTEKQNQLTDCELCTFQTVHWLRGWDAVIGYPVAGICQFNYKPHHLHRILTRLSTCLQDHSTSMYGQKATSCLRYDVHTYNTHVNKIFVSIIFATNKSQSKTYYIW